MFRTVQFGSREMSVDGHVARDLRSTAVGGWLSVPRPREYGGCSVQSGHNSASLSLGSHSKGERVTLRLGWAYRRMVPGYAKSPSQSTRQIRLSGVRSGSFGSASMSINGSVKVL